MTPAPESPRELARRIRSLRRLDRHADPETFAVQVESIAEALERLDRTPLPRSPRYWRAAS